MMLFPFFKKLNFNTFIHLLIVGEKKQQTNYQQFNNNNNLSMGSSDILVFLKSKIH